MSLLPKLQILEQDIELYDYVIVQDITGVYDPSTNPGGYGAPNAETTDVLKTLLGSEYGGNQGTIAEFVEVPKLEIMGAGTLWTQPFLEGVTRIIYLVGVDISGGSFTGLKGNLQFTLNNANAELAGAHYIEIEGVIYALDVARGLTSSGGWVLSPFVQDHLAVSGIQYYEGGVYSLWNEQGKRALVQEISALSCTSLQCGALGLDLAMTRYRFYLATGIEFDKGNYSKAHNLAVSLSPELTTTNCPTC